MSKNLYEHPRLIVTRYAGPDGVAYQISAHENLLYPDQGMTSVSVSEGNAFALAMSILDDLLPRLEARKRNAKAQRRRGLKAVAR